MRLIHESVAAVLADNKLSVSARGVNPGNNREILGEMTIGDRKATITLKGHPVFGTREIDAATVKEAKAVAFNICRKAGGFPIFEKVEGKTVSVSFTRDKAKASITEATQEDQEDETDGTGEASGDTKTNVKTKVDKANTDVGVKATVDTKNGQDRKVDEGAVADEKKTADAQAAADKGKLFNKDKLASFKDKLAKKRALFGKKDKSKEEVAEEAQLDLDLDLLCEEFYDALQHPVTFVLYPEGKAEVHGLNEDELAPFGGTAPAVPAKYAKKAQDGHPDSKINMGVLTLYKTEGMSAQSQQILTGKDFKACGFGAPGKGYGKQSRWTDTGKQPIDRPGNGNDKAGMKGE